MADAWPLDLWQKIDLVVREKGYMGANDNFTALKNAVAKASAAELARQSVHAQLAWEFLVAFAEQKPQYRSHITKVAATLAGARGWRSAYMANPQLRERALALHVDLREAFELAAEPEEEREEQEEAATSGATKWPDWGAVQAVVATGSYAGANELFGMLRRAVGEADVEGLDAQRTRASLVWEFLVGFAEKKHVFRLHITGVVESLLAVDSWKRAWASRSDLHARVPALHADLQAALLPGTLTNDEPVIDAAPRHVDSESTPDRRAPPSLPAAKPQVPGVDTSSAAAARSAGGAEERAPLLVDDAAVKLVRPYLQRAADLEASEPVVAHYCRVHAVELLIRARRDGKATAESKALMLEVLEEAEAKKQELQQQFDLSSRGQEMMEAFAYRFFQNANSADLVREQAGNTAHQQLYMASLFLDVLAQFHGGILPPETAEASQYAKRRALHVRRCAHSGADPGVPDPPALGGVTNTPPPCRAEGTPSSAARVASAPAAGASSAAPQHNHHSVLAAPAPTAPTACAPLASPQAASLGAGWSQSKRQAEAKKRAGLAASALDSGDGHRAGGLIREALALLEGL